MASQYDEYLEWERQKNSRWNKVSKQIKPFHVLGVLVIFAIGNSLVTSGKINNTFFWGVAVAFGILFLFLMFRETAEQKLIPEHIIKQIAQNALENKRRQGIEVPFDAKVKVNLVGESIWEQDFISRTSGVIKREVGFEVIRKGYKKKGVIGIHPYNGTILGLRWEQFGYSGKETKDRTIIPAGVVSNPNNPQTSEKEF